MTTLMDLYAKEEERMRTAFASGKTPDKAVLLLQETCERLLYSYNNEADVSDRVKESAANMLQAVRASMSIMDTAGEIRVWESAVEPSDSAEVGFTGQQAARAAKKAAKKHARELRKAKLRAFGIRFMVLLLVLAGLFGTGAGLYILYYNHRDMIELNELLQPGAMIISAGLSIFVGGFLFALRKLPVIDEKTQRVEFSVDTEKVFSSFRTILMLIDRSLERIAAAEKAERSRLPGTIEGMGTEELDMFAGLLEAACESDEGLALERIADVRFYLHKQGIEILEYDEEHKECFDLMPGEENRTIRPALLKDGRLLKKGLASA